MTIVKEFEILKHVLDDTPDVLLAVLFGSAATRRLRRGSDLDVGILLAEGAHLPSALSVALERAAGRPVDVILLNAAPPLLRLEIAREGVPLVERAPYAWADFRARAMIDWWDWAPTARMMHAVMAERLQDEARRGSS